MNSIFAVDIATGEVIENKLPNSEDSGDGATCFSDHMAAVVCNRGSGQKQGISGFDDATGKLVWGYDSSSNRVVPKITTLYNGLVYGQADTQPAILDAKTGQDVIAPSATPSAYVRAGLRRKGRHPTTRSSGGYGNVGGWGDLSLLSGNQQSPVMVSKYGSVYLQEPGNKANRQGREDPGGPEGHRLTQLNDEGPGADLRAGPSSYRAQMSVRWKFLYERDGVGPRWPW